MTGIVGGGAPALAQAMTGVVGDGASVLAQAMAASSVLASVVASLVVASSVVASSVVARPGLAARVEGGVLRGLPVRWGEGRAAVLSSEWGVRVGSVRPPGGRRPQTLACCRSSRASLHAHVVRGAARGLCLVPQFWSATVQSARRVLRVMSRPPKSVSCSRQVAAGRNSWPVAVLRAPLVARRWSASPPAACDVCRPKFALRI